MEIPTSTALNHSNSFVIAKTPRYKTQNFIVNIEAFLVTFDKKLDTLNKEITHHIHSLVNSLKELSQCETLFKESHGDKSKIDEALIKQFDPKIPFYHEALEKDIPGIKYILDAECLENPKSPEAKKISEDRLLLMIQDAKLLNSSFDEEKDVIRTKNSKGRNVIVLRNIDSEVFESFFNLRQQERQAMAEIEKEQKQLQQTYPEVITPSKLEDKTLHSELAQRQRELGMQPASHTEKAIASKAKAMQIAH